MQPGSYITLLWSVEINPDFHFTLFDASGKDGFHIQQKGTLGK